MPTFTVCARLQDRLLAAIQIAPVTENQRPLSGEIAGRKLYDVVPEVLGDIILTARD
ncbi:MAG: hypothetical protein ACRDJL_05100 [Actinomycetota bacterium]